MKDPVLTFWAFGTGVLTGLPLKRYCHQKGTSFIKK